MRNRTSLSGGFTPCRHLRPFSGRELIQSGDGDHLMNETRRKPTTGTRCPTLSFVYPVMVVGLIKVLRHKADLNCRPDGLQSNTPTTIPTKSEDQLYPGSSRGDLLPVGGSSAKTSPPRVGHPRGARKANNMTDRTSARLPKLRPGLDLLCLLSQCA